jgi:transposase
MKESGTYIMLLDEIRLQGKSISETARKTGMARNTIRKYLKEGECVHKLKGTRKPSKLDPYKRLIGEMLGQGIYNCQVMLRRLKEDGYGGSLSILKDYVKPLRPPAIKAGPAVKRYETEPGEQAQMDWGIMHYTDMQGKVSKLMCFAMVLGNGRNRFLEFTRRSDTKSLIRCMLNGFTYFGGIPKTVLTDRMKTVLLSMDNGQPNWQSEFKAFAADAGFVPKVCRARRPQTKGKVERLIRYAKDNFMAGRRFVDLNDLNGQALAWCDHVNNKVHGSTGEIPALSIKREQLKPIPVPIERYRWQQRKVSKDCFVSYDGTRYGINWHYCGQEVLVMQKDEELLIASGYGELICKHQYCGSSGKQVTVKGQYDGLEESEGKPYQPPYGIQVPANDVEIRSLDVYAALTGGNVTW